VKTTKNSIYNEQVNTLTNTIVSKDNKPFYSGSTPPYFFRGFLTIKNRLFFRDFLYIFIKIDLKKYLTNIYNEQRRTSILEKHPTRIHFAT